MIDPVIVAQFLIDKKKLIIKRFWGKILGPNLTSNNLNHKRSAEILSKFYLIQFSPNANPIWEKGVLNFKLNIRSREWNHITLTKKLIINRFWGKICRCFSARVFCYLMSLNYAWSNLKSAFESLVSENFVSCFFLRFSFLLFFFAPASERQLVFFATNNSKLNYIFSHCVIFVSECLLRPLQTNKKSKFRSRGRLLVTVRVSFWDTFCKAL